MNTRIFLSTTVASLFTASAFFWSGCGGDTTSGTADSGGPDTTTETGQQDVVAETPPAEGSASDAPAEAADGGGGDGASFGGDGAIFCPNAPCPGSQKCCAIPPPVPPDAGDAGEGGLGEGGLGDAGIGGLQCLDECPDGGPAIACEGPKGCGGSTPVCCANITIEGTLPGCYLGSASSSCSATCNQNFALACGGSMDTVVLCATSADCTDPNLPSCCELAQLPNVPFCAPSLVAMIGTCH
jgi:hypothetical protein